MALFEFGCIVFIWKTCLSLYKFYSSNLNLIDIISTTRTHFNIDWEPMKILRVSQNGMNLFYSVLKMTVNRA